MLPYFTFIRCFNTIFSNSVPISSTEKENSFLSPLKYSFNSRMTIFNNSSFVFVTGSFTSIIFFILLYFFFFFYYSLCISIIFLIIILYYFYLQFIINQSETLSQLTLR